jgi:hypothetical protein
VVSTHGSRLGSHGIRCGAGALSFPPPSSIPKVQDKQPMLPDACPSHLSLIFFSGSRCTGAGEGAHANDVRVVELAEDGALCAHVNGLRHL